MSLEEATKESRREEMLKVPTDHVLPKLYRDGVLPTVQNYLQLNYLGEITSLDQVGEEDRAEIDQLIEDGYLVNIASQRVN